MAEKSDLQVLAGFFGKLPGQSLKDMAAEFKLLTEQDKAELAGGIRDGSLTYPDPE